MKSGLTTLQEKFVELILDDNFYTNKQMADLLNCDERTIYKMKQNERVAEEIEKLADTGLKMNINRAYGVLQDILFDEESSPMARIKALDLYLKTQGKLKEKAETDVTLQVSSKEQAEAELDALLNL